MAVAKLRLGTRAVRLPLVAIYFAGAVLAYLAIYFVIENQCRHFFDELPTSELVVSSKPDKYDQAIVAEAKRYGIRVANRSTNAPGDTELRIPAVAPQTTLSGTSAIEFYLYTKSTDAQGRRGGQVALLVFISACVVGVMLPTVFSAAAQVSPVLMLIAGTGFAASCQKCSLSSGHFDNLASIGLIAISTWGAWEFWKAGPSRKPALIAFAGVTVAAQITQIWLMALAPKFCVFCLMAGIGLILSIGTVLMRLTGQEAVLMKSKSLSRFGIGFGAIALAYEALQLMGVGLHSSMVGFPANLPNPTDRSIAQYMPSFKPEGTQVVLISKQGCQACETAKAALQASGIRYNEYPPCTYIQTTGCFDGGSFGFGTPLVFVVDPKGQIKYFHEGWPYTFDGAQSLIQSVTDHIKEIP